MLSTRSVFQRICCSDTTNKHKMAFTNVIKKMNLIEYPGHDQKKAEENNRSWLNLSDIRPEQVQNWTDLGDQMIAIARIKLTSNGKDTNYSFLSLPFSQLISLYNDLKEEDRTLCAIVLDNSPCHMFFDFDGKIEDDKSTVKSKLIASVIKQEQKLIDVFSEVFHEFFLLQFKRKPNMTGVYWEKASTEKKFSLHLHIVSEAFVSIQHHNEFMKRFKLYLQDHQQDNLLCRHKQDKEFVHLLDFGIYNKNRNFRLIGCRKPGGQPLERFVIDEDASTRYIEELLFAGLPSYSFRGSEDQQLLVCTPPVKLARGTRTVASEVKHDSDDDDAEIVPASVETEDLVKRMLAQLCTTRADDYSQWRDVIWCVRGLGCNIDLAHEFSKRSERHDASAVNKMWNSFETEKAKWNVGTIRNWLKVDLGEVWYQIEWGHMSKCGEDSTKDDRLDFNIIETIKEKWKSEGDAVNNWYNKLSKREKKENIDKYQNDLDQVDQTWSNKLVKYCNKYWAVIVQETKAMVIEEFVSYRQRDKKFKYNTVVRTARDFTEITSNRVVTQFSQKKTSISVAKFWLNHPGRRECDKIVFEPYAEGYINTCKFKNFNHFNGLEVSKIKAAAFCVGKDWKKMIQPLLKHILNVWCSKNCKLFKYVMCWIARLVQTPWEKLGTAIVLRGKQGSGKGIIIEKLGQVLGERYYFHVHNAADVTGTYTHNLLHTLLCFMDEAFWGGERDQAGILKKLVTEAQHSINAKYMPSYMVDSYLNLIFASNQEWVVPCDLVERRYVCLDVDGTLSGSQTTGSKAYFDNILNIPAEVFAYYLYSKDTSDFNPRSIPTTSMQRDQKTLSLPIFHKWWLEVISTGEIVCDTYPKRNDDERKDDPWGRPLYKDLVYKSFEQFAFRQRYIPTNNQFWKKIRELVPSIAEKKRSSNGSRQITVQFPSLKECRDYWRCQIVKDEEWIFDDEELEDVDETVDLDDFDIEEEEEKEKTTLENEQVMNIPENDEKKPTKKLNRK